MYLRNLLRTCVAAGMLVSTSVCARALFDIDTILHDAGTLREGMVGSITHNFVFTNRGDTPLFIRNVRANCGCSAVTYDSLVDPGAQGRFSLQVSLEGLEAGEHRKTLQVTSNAAGQSNLTLTLRFFYLRHISTDPSMLFFPAGDTSPVAFTLYADSRELVVKKISFAPDSGFLPAGTAFDCPVEFSIAPSSGAPDETGRHAYAVEVSARPTHRAEGLFTLLTNHPRMPRYKIRATLDK